MIEPLPDRVFGTRAASASGSPESDEDGQAQEGSQDKGATQGREGESGSSGEDARAMTIEVTQGQRKGGPGAEHKAWRDTAMARVAAAVRMMRDQGIQNMVLIGVGEGADMALRYAQANAATFPPGGLGLVWLDARFREPYEQPLDEVLGDGYSIPVLDLYDREGAGERAPARQAAAERGGFKNYTQSALPMPRQSRDAAQRRLGAWVGGWLNDTMPGTEAQ